VIVAQRIAERVTSTPIQGFEGMTINMTFGIAACPQDGKTAGELLGAAIEARKYARQNNLLLVEFKAMT
jgi:GGDEF domain-containing protein